MKIKPNVAELLAKAQKPSEDSLRLHPFYWGKLEVTPKCRIKDSSDFAIWHSPGVAAPCRDIAAHPEQVFVHTNKGNFIAIVSNKITCSWSGRYWASRCVTSDGGESDPVQVSRGSGCFSCFSGDRKIPTS